MSTTEAIKRVHSKVEDLGMHFVKMEYVHRNPQQPRVTFDEQELRDLAENIKDNGLLQPIVIRELGENNYVIIAGERRWRAHGILTAEEIKCIVVRCDDKAAYELSVIENLQRKDLNLLEEARGYRHLKDEFKYTLDELGKVVSKSPSNVGNIMSVLNEDERVQEYVKKGVLTLALLVYLKQLPNVREKLELLRKLEEEKVKRTDARKYIQHVKEAYRIAEELGVDPQEILEKKRKNKGKGGRFDVKEELVPGDFKFHFIIDNLLAAEDLAFFPKVCILTSAFAYMHNKSASKQLSKLLFARSELVESWMADSGVVPAARNEQWDFFEKTDQLWAWYAKVRPDVCVSLDVPAYAPVLKKWGLGIDEIINRTVENARKFKQWKPEFDTTKVWVCQGLKPEDYLTCFQKLHDAGCFEEEECKIGVGFGAIAKLKLENILKNMELVLNHPDFQRIKDRLSLVHGFGIGQPKRICRMYQEGINSFDALTCTILTATGQYWCRDGYYFHIAPESSGIRRVRLLFNVNSFWGCLMEEFTREKGVEPADEERNGVQESLEKLKRGFGISSQDNMTLEDL